MTNDIKKEIEENYIKNQLLRSQLSTMLSEKSMLEADIERITKTIDAIKEIEKLKKGDNIWASLDSGVFVSANIENPNELFVEIGSNIIKKKTLANTIEMLENRINEIRDVIQKLDQQISQYVKEIKNIESILQDLAKKAGG